MTQTLLLLAGLFGGWFLRSILTAPRPADEAAESLGQATLPPGSPAAETERPADAPTAPKADAAAMAEAGPRQRIYEIVAPLYELYHQSAHPNDLLDDATFKRALALLDDRESFSVTDLLEYYAGDNAIVSLLALEALTLRDADPRVVDGVLSHVNTIAVTPRWFALRAIDHHAGDEPVVMKVLQQLDDHWDGRIELKTIAEFVERRLARGEEPVLRGGVAKKEWHDEVLGQLENDESTREFVVGFKALVHSLDLEFLRGVGAVRTPEDEAVGGFLDGDHLASSVDEILRGIRRSPRRSSLVVGDLGVGKTTCLELVARGALASGWTVFEAGANDLLAGQSYMGQLEERVRKLVQNLDDQPIVWLVADFHGLLLAGQHKFSEAGVVDILMPHIESGRIAIVGEATTAGHEKLLRERPRIRSSFDLVRLEPLSDDATRRLARGWAEYHAIGSGTSRVPVADGGLVDEALQLARQYLADTAQPGCLMRLLEVARQLAGGADLSRPLDLDDLITTLGSLTGLPSTILDEREGLDLDGLRAHFDARVMGQPEAVGVLVERVAMIKAGLTDPGRPQGVFLFAGPTGTGKTEIAKALAEFLFGSPDRMVRFDMSELQGHDGVDRILGGSDSATGDRAFVHEIRKQPFTVVLLDEVEKAHPRIWDLFLQVFDDGRISDRVGRVADCRHAIFILTSNLGARAASESGLAFGSGSTDASDRAVREAFRPEFLNRIDRVVRFRPLTRSTLREVLMKELDRVLDRRGFRNRQWAVEWDSSAVDFLLQQGYTTDLGARPLRRAIERWLLAPLAETIVRHEAPAGDQFLFVRSDGSRIEVDFVDPDASPTPSADSRVAANADGAVGEDFVSLRRTALESTGAVHEIELVAARCALLTERVQNDDFRADKARAFEAMGEPGFWEDEGRFVVLGRAEYMDRIENATRSAGRLLQRLTGAPVGSPPRRSQCDPEMLARLAERVWLLEQSLSDLVEHRRPDAVVGIEIVRDPRRTGAVVETQAFADRICTMYRGWSERRGMDLVVLAEGEGNGDEPYDVLVAEVSGFAASRILLPELGLHVFEHVDDGGSVLDRLRVRVTVAEHDGRPPEHEPRARLRAARSLLDAARGDRAEVVRRYREAPSPLVRDGVRGYRTGRLDRVFEGDFDLIV